MSAATTVEPRRPARRSAERAALAYAVAEREQAYRAAGWSMLVAGVAALLLGLLVIAGVIATVDSQLPARFHLAWPLQIALVAGGVTPLLFWWEHRTRGGRNEDLIAHGTLVAALAGCGGRGGDLRTTAAGGAAVCEVLLVGPRMILAARERWRSHTAAPLIAEAQALIHYLRLFDNGLLVRELPTLRRGPVVHYLVSRNWVGVSPSGDHVWLLPDARRALGLKAIRQ